MIEDGTCNHHNTAGLSSHLSYTLLVPHFFENTFCPSTMAGGWGVNGVIFHHEREAHLLLQMSILLL